jgi:hypothetical protein
VVISSQYVCADGLLSSGVMSGWSFTNEAVWASNLVDPGTVDIKAEAVVLQGEDAIPVGVLRLSGTSPLYPHR